MVKAWFIYGSICYSPTMTRFCSCNDLSSGKLLSLSMVLLMQAGMPVLLMLLRAFLMAVRSIWSCRSLTMHVGTFLGGKSEKCGRLVGKMK